MQNPGAVVFNPQTVQPQIVCNTQTVQPQMLYNTQTLPNTIGVSTNSAPMNETPNPEVANYMSASAFPGNNFTGDFFSCWT